MELLSKKLLLTLARFRNHISLELLNMVNNKQTKGRVMKRVWYTAAVAGVALLFAGNANAVTTTYLITNTNTCNGGCTTGPFGTVTDNIGPTSSTITVTLSSSYALMGGAGVFGFDLVGDPTINFSGFNSSTNGAFSATSPQTNTNTALDGFGKFEYIIDAPGSGGSTPNGTTLTFTIDSTAALVSNSSTANQWLFAVEICNVSGCGNGLTGFAGGGTVCTFNCSNQEVTPLPAALPLFASVLGGGLAFSTWRRKRRTVGSKQQALAA